MLFKLLNDSFFIKKADYIILFFIAVLLTAITFAPTKIIGLLAGVCFLMLMAKISFAEGKKLTFNEFDGPIFFYITITGLSVIFSPLFMPSLKGYLKILTYFCVYLTFFNVLGHSRKRTYFVLAIIALGAFGESIFAIYQNFTGVEALATWQDRSGLNPEQLMTRVYGTLQPYNPNLLAGYLVACIPAAAGLFFFLALKGKTRLSALALVATLAIATAIVFTGSRGAYIALFAVITVIMLISGHIIWHDFSEKPWLKKLWLFILLAGAAGAIAIIILSPALQHRIASIIAFREDSSNAFRLNVYLSSLKMFLDNWLIGIGPGNETFRLMYGMYMKTGFDALGTYSVPLDIAVGSGVFALAAFLRLIFNVLTKGAGIILLKTDIEQKIIISACITGIIGLMAHGLFDTIFFRPQVHIIFWLFIAIISASFNKTHRVC